MDEFKTIPNDFNTIPSGRGRFHADSADFSGGGRLYLLLIDFQGLIGLSGVKLGRAALFGAALRLVWVGMG